MSKKLKVEPWTAEAHKWDENWRPPAIRTLPRYVDKVPQGFPSMTLCIISLMGFVIGFVIVLWHITLITE